jgi:NADH:ubiquinone oxidoreductase subunit 6 (subunit J)
MHFRPRLSRYTEGVLEKCSCGTVLVENALFCHRCGKAQRELIPGQDTPAADEIAPQEILAPPPSAVVAPPINFSNNLAVRLAFLMASVASVLDQLPVLGFFSVIWAICAGFAAVRFYRRASGRSLTVREGAKMGWITGVFNSLIFTVLTSLSIAADSADFNAQFHQQIRQKAQSDPALLAVLDNPYMMAIMILMILFLVFIFVAGACVGGGALAARVARDDRAPGHQPR